MIIVGSKAAEHWGLNRTKPKDTDIWYRGEQGDAVPHEDSFYCPEHIYDMVEVEDKIFASKDALYTIKCSHLGVNPHIENERIWWKHVQDILYMEYNGCCIIPYLYEALVEYWQSSGKDKSFLSLKADKEDFFNDFVEYRYDHDYLHELVSYPKRPMYEQCLKEGEEVLLDKSLFNRLEYPDKIRMFREEITVIACERWLLSPKNTLSWYQAYLKSLKKTITRLTKNWACDFIIFNLDEFVVPDYSYFKHLLTTLKEDSMSNVDMSIFNKIAADMGESLDECIYGLCEWGLSSDLEAKYDYEHLEQEGGGEGGSEFCYGVFRLGDKFYRAEYSYYSHHGCDYDGIEHTLKEVKPTQKYVTVYE